MILLFIFALSLVDICSPSTLQSVKLVPKDVDKSSFDSATSEDANSGSKYVYKIKKGSCKCVDIVDDPCDVEMTEESVVKAKGSSCPKGKRYCCAREKHLVNLFKAGPSSVRNPEKPNLSDSQILRDEISNYAKVTVASGNEQDPSKIGVIEKISDSGSKDEDSAIIRPTVLRAILSFLTQGIKLIGRVFSR